MRVLLGVTGGIAAYKSCQLVRELIHLGHDVRVVMTQSATQFVNPLTFQVLSQNPVGLELFDPTYESEIGHIELARWADVIVVAPATANFIAKCAYGIADDLLSTVVVATRVPIVVAPAMNTVMWDSEVVRANLNILEGRGIVIVAPDSGKLACNEVGAGRLPDPHAIIDGITRAITVKSLKNRRILITAGPTREWIDAARFLSNPSTGKMGFALAAEAAARGADVTLVAGPVNLPTPAYPNLRRIDVESAQEMHDVVFDIIDSGANEHMGLSGQSEYRESQFSSLGAEYSTAGYKEARVDVVIMAAAVADLRPILHDQELQDAPLEAAMIDELGVLEPEDGLARTSEPSAIRKRPDYKLPKSEIFGQLQFSRNPDILQELGVSYPVGKLPLVVGFAAQSENVETQGDEKRRRKKAHMMVANKIGGSDSSFGAEHSKVCLLVDPYFKDAAPMLWTPHKPKLELARDILDRIELLLDYVDPRAEVVPLNDRARGLRLVDPFNTDGGIDE